MRNHILALIFVASVISGCNVVQVRPETKNDIAHCSMGISSGVELKGGASMEVNGGKVDASVKEELKGAFVDKFGKEDAIAAMDKYQSCMDKLYEDRKTAKKQADISACKASWSCDMNVVAGVCTCNQVINESGKKYGWTERKMAQEYAQLCSSKKVLQCWPPTGDLNKMRAECQTVLKEADIPMPLLDSATCKVSS